MKSGQLAVGLQISTEHSLIDFLGIINLIILEPVCIFMKQIEDISGK